MVINKLHFLLQKYIRRIALIGVILLCASCNDNTSSSVLSIVSQWEGKEIIFPENIVFTRQGRDTVNFQFLDAPFKILNYVDSTGCMSCKWHLSFWNRLINELDSLTERQVPVVFFINAPNKTELEIITYREQFNYPICYDAEDVLNTLNHFPEEETFQTFLLDRNNKVIAIGNPVNNPKIKSLYFSLISNGKYREEKLPDTSVSIDTNDIYFGVVEQGGILQHKVTLTNTGNEPLTILEILPSCDCITTKYPKEPIPPSQSIDIQVIFNVDEKGSFDKSLSIYCNTSTSPIEIWLTGEIK